MSFSPPNTAHPGSGPTWLASYTRFVGGVVADRGGLLLAIGGMPDHIHLLVELRPHPSVAYVVMISPGLPLPE